MAIRQPWVEVRLDMATDHDSYVRNRCSGDLRDERQTFPHSSRRLFEHGPACARCQEDHLSFRYVQPELANVDTSAVGYIAMKSSDLRLTPNVGEEVRFAWLDVLIAEHTT